LAVLGAAASFATGCIYPYHAEPEFGPHPPVPASQRTAATVAVIEFENWNPPDDYDTANILIPLVPYSESIYQKPSRLGLCLSRELTVSAAFADVHYYEKWPDDLTAIARSTLLVSGRVLRNRVSHKETFYGLSLPLGLTLAFTVLPANYDTRSLEFEVTAARGEAPERELLREAIALPSHTVAFALGNLFVPIPPFADCPGDRLRPRFAAIRDRLIELARR